MRSEEPVVLVIGEPSHCHSIKIILDFLGEASKLIEVDQFSSFIANNPEPEYEVVVVSSPDNSAIDVSALLLELDNWNPSLPVILTHGLTSPEDLDPRLTHKVVAQFSDNLTYAPTVDALYRAQVYNK